MKQLLSNQRVVGIVFLAIFSVYLWSTNDIYLDFWSEEEVFNARSMPYLIGGLGAVLCFLLILLPTKAYDWSQWSAYNWKAASALLVCLAVFSFGLEYLGFVLAASLLLFSAFLVLGERRIMIAASVSIGLVTGFWWLMKLLGIYLAPGELWQSIL